MTKPEAREYIAWYKDQVDTSHYLAHFPSHIPFYVTNPEALGRKRESEIVLGINQWQRPFNQLQKVYPGLTREKYNNYRIKYNIT